MTDSNCDVAIIGGGPVGAALAIALQGNDLNVVLLEAREAEINTTDPRSLALSYGTRLLLQRQAEEAAERKEMAGDVKASWGDQMRSYVLQPYQMVKDLRTEHEVGNPSAVFDGDIDDFIEAGIRWRRQSG